MAARAGTARKDGFDKPAKYVVEPKAEPDALSRSIYATYDRMLKESVKPVPPYPGVWAKYLSEPPKRSSLTEMFFVGGPLDDITKYESLSPGVVTYCYPQYDGTLVGLVKTHRYQLSVETGEWLWMGAS